MRWSPFASSTWELFAFLWLGLDGKCHTAIHASKNGLRVTINGVTGARGKDPDGLLRDYHRFVAKVRKEERGS